MANPEVITYRIGVEKTHTGMLLALADAHGIKQDVVALLKDAELPRNDKRGLAQLLRGHREAYGYSIHTVHTRSNISRSQLSHYESVDDPPKNPGLRTIQALAYGYRLPFITVLMAALNGIHPRMSVPTRERPDGPDTAKR